ncbi:hypothetical protein ACRN9N_20290 [Shewanella baltica]|uniref:hypothetical protein n=1 Tax=Shewanella baltica TaxID=62322 RepID=UPI003D7B259A
MPTIKKAETNKDAIRLARIHAAEALKEQTLHSSIWCTESVECVYQSELYRLADEVIAKNDKA